MRAANDISALLLSIRSMMAANRTRRVTSVVEWAGPISVGSTPGIIWTLMPSGKSTWLHQTANTLTADATKMADFTDKGFVRLFTSVQNAGAAANTAIGVDVSTDNSTWDTLVSLTIGNTTGAKDSGWTAIPAAYQREVYIRLYGQNGNGIKSPRFSSPTLMVR